MKQISLFENFDGLMPQLIEILTNSKEWYSDKCTLNWDRKYMGNNRYIFKLISKSLLTNKKYKGMMPTPTATDWKGAYPPSSINKNPARRYMIRNVYQYEDKEYNSKDSQLNPFFVEEMMGFPKNWTTDPFKKLIKKDEQKG